MSHPSRPSSPHRLAKRTVTPALGALLLLTVSAGAANGQAADRFESTLDHYDAVTVEAHLDAARGQLADRHGPLARTLFDMHEALMVTPHDLKARPQPPAIARLRHRVEPAHLVHYQAENGGHLGTLHGSTAHPIGLTWFPHSMFAQSGRVFGQWGHALLLGAVVAHVERHTE